jgi:CRISPR-associated protein Csb2
MIAIEFEFLTGRYHATPWGRHVNEGAIEWPISPWRIARALVSVYHNKAQADVTEAQLRSIVTAVASPPVFELPEAVQAHTRHYMPQYKGATAKVIDAFVHVKPGAAMRVVWPDAELPPDERRAFRVLLDRLGYLGRAESWVSARLLDTWDGAFNAEPAFGHGAGDGEPIRLLAPQAQEGYAAWREPELARRKEAALAKARAKAVDKGKDPFKVKLSAAESSRIEAELPATIFDALYADTGELRSQGWSQPPGSQWIEYRRPKEAFAVQYSAPKPSQVTRPSVARYALAGNVLPSFLEGVAFAERIRVALMSRSKDERGNAAPVFSGKSDAGERLDDDHGHAHVLPESYGTRGRHNITHLTIHARAAFSSQEQAALRGLAKVWGQGGHDVQLVFLGLGRPEDFGGPEGATGASPVLHASRVWVSRTPFVLTRHPKTNRRGEPKIGPDGLQVDGAEAQLRRELARQGLPAPSHVQPIGGTPLGGKLVAWRDFRRRRVSGDGAAAGHTGYGFRIEFLEPVRGPLVFGYGRHFGLGQFVPEGAAT